METSLFVVSCEQRWSSCLEFQPCDDPYSSLEEATDNSKQKKVRGKQNCVHKLEKVNFYTPILEL